MDKTSKFVFVQRKMRGFHVIACQFLKAIRGKVNRLHPTFSVIDHDSRKEELSRLAFSFVLEEGN